MKSRRDERVLRRLDQDEQILARFWSHVDKGTADAGAAATSCWRWFGSMSKRHPTLRIGSFEVSAVRVAWWTVTGAFPSGGRFIRTCGDRACVCPDHLAWQLGKATERGLDSYGPLAPSGVALRVAVADERPVVLRFVSREAASALRLAG
jgi:hypothetical protein